MKNKILKLLFFTCLLSMTSYAQIQEIRNDINSINDQIVDVKVKYINATDAIHIGYVYNDATGLGLPASFDTRDPIVYRTDVNNNVTWRRIYHKAFAGEFKGITFTSDNQIVCVGFTSDGPYQIVDDSKHEGYAGRYKALITKLDLSGNVTWHYEYFDNINTANGEAFFDVCELLTPDHRLAVCGAHNYYPGTSDQMYCIYSSAGLPINTSVLDHYGSDLASSISTWGNGNEAIVAGWVNNNQGSTGYNGTIVHLNSNGGILNYNEYTTPATSTFNSIWLEDIQTKAGATTTTGTIMDIDGSWFPNSINSMILNVDASFNLNGWEINEVGSTYNYYVKAKRLGNDDYAFHLASSNSLVFLEEPNSNLDTKIGRLQLGSYLSQNNVDLAGAQILNYIDMNSANTQLKFAGLNRNSGAFTNDAFTINSDLSFTASDICPLSTPELESRIARLIPDHPDFNQVNFTFAQYQFPIYLYPIIDKKFICGDSTPIDPGNPTDTACADCNDSCYWRTTGNNIIGTRNIFGTITPNDVRIFTSNSYRGIISANGHWGMGTTAGHIPDAILQVRGTTPDRHIDVTGVSPSIKFYPGENLPALPNTGPKIGLATSVDDFTEFSGVGDFIVENTSAASLIFGTNWSGSNSLERMKINKDGEVGINTVNSTPKEPTAYLHVNCINNNPNNNSGLSDVRFENLEEGRGSILVIDNATGYVFNSKRPIPSGTGIANSCTTINRVPKVTSASGDLGCSQIFDNGISVGINTTGPFNYTWSGGLTGPIFPPLSGTVRLDVDGVTRSLAYIATSDEAAKTNIQPILNANEIIAKLEGKTYSWNQKTLEETKADDSRQYGFIAQDLAKILPEAVSIDAGGKYGVNYNMIIPVITESQKGMLKELDIQKAKNLLLEKEVIELKEKLQEVSDAILACCKAYQPSNQNLFQVSPNPTTGNITVDYFVKSSAKNSILTFTDENGNLLFKIDLDCNGYCTKNITLPSEITSSLINCTLYVDGQVNATAKIVLVNNN